MANVAMAPSEPDMASCEATPSSEALPELLSRAPDARGRVETILTPLWLRSTLFGSLDPLALTAFGPVTDPFEAVDPFEDPFEAVAVDPFVDPFEAVDDADPFEDEDSISVEDPFDAFLPELVSPLVEEPLEEEEKALGFTAFLEATAFLAS